MSRRVEADEDWKRDAACGTADPFLFFPPGDGEAKMSGLQEAAARAVCASCTVVAQCYGYSELHGERVGMWGGVNKENERGSRSRTAL